jgi:hypothetical protein
MPGEKLGIWLKKYLIMKQEEGYKEVLKRLKAVKPVLDNRKELTDRVMRSVMEIKYGSGPVERVWKFLFSWVATPWLRTSMAILAIGFIVAFSMQQMKMSQRISQLERQLTLALDETAGYAAGPAITERVLMNMLVREQQNDSITVSTRDLEALMNSLILLIEDPAYKHKFNRVVRPAGKNNRSCRSAGSSKDIATKEL